jgi:hypothetical protein
MCERLDMILQKFRIIDPVEVGIEEGMGMESLGVPLSQVMNEGMLVQLADAPSLQLAEVVGDVK